MLKNSPICVGPKRNVNAFIVIVLSTFVFPPLSLSVELLQLSKIEGSVLTTISEQVLVEAYQKLDMKIEFVSFPAKRGLMISNEGTVDGEVHRIKKVDYKYPNLIRVPTAINLAEVVVFTIKNQFKIEGWHSLKPYKIGILRGIVVVEQGTRDMDVEAFNSYDQVLMMLNFKRIDVGVLTRIGGLYYLRGLEFKDIKMLEPPILQHGLYHYLHVKHEALVPRINGELIKMQSSGRIKEIRMQYIKSLQARPRIELPRHAL